MAVQKPENAYRGRVHKFLPQGLLHEKMNNPYRSGTPDDYYSGNKADLWVEYKYLPSVPQRAVVRPADPEKMLSVLQMNWINAHYDLWKDDPARNVAVIIGCPEGGVILQDKEWMEEFTADEFRKRIRMNLSVAAWIEGSTMR